MKYHQAADPLAHELTPLLLNQILHLEQCAVLDGKTHIEAPHQTATSSTVHDNSCHREACNPGIPGFREKYSWVNRRTLPKLRNSPSECHIRYLLDHRDPAIDRKPNVAALN